MEGSYARASDDQIAQVLKGLAFLPPTMPPLPARRVTPSVDHLDSHRFRCRPKLAAAAPDRLPMPQKAAPIL